MMKEERIRRLIPDMQNGRWYFPATLAYIDAEGRKFDLIEEMKSEMRSFPRARHDDILDALARVYESDLFLVFPKLRGTMGTMAQRAYREAASSAPDDWQNW